MRKICPSSKTPVSSRFSVRALASSDPNGFSTMTRDQPFLPLVRSLPRAFKPAASIWRAISG